MTCVAAWTRDEVDMTGQLHVWSHRRGPAWPTNVALVHYFVHFVLGGRRHWNNNSGVSRYLETVEVSITAGAIAALVGISYGHNHACLNHVCLMFGSTCLNIPRSSAIYIRTHIYIYI